MEPSKPPRAAAATGPGNKTIATTLLELLAVRGRAGARARGLKALGLDEAGLAEAPAWLDGEALDRLLVAVEVDAGLARALGHRLCAPDATGLSLYGLGLATPEKAYRRIGSLLPRAQRDGRWRVHAMGPANAVVAYEPGDAEHAGAPAAGRSHSAVAARTEPLHCALRTGMLEAIPGLYGLLPAQVAHPACRARGDAECRYAIDWRRGERRGVVFGAGAGLALALAAAGLAATGALGAAFGAGAAAVLGLALIALGVAAGRAVDLGRQLLAVAGARRGHLALFDQVDAVLAEKLDAISRLDASLEQGPAPRRVVRDGTFDEEPLSLVDLRALVERVIAKASPQTADWATIRLEADERLRRVACEPVQIEQVVDELLQNAIEASLGAGDAPEIKVALRDVPRGVELSIEDQGQGIDANDVDETFDPFFDERPIGLDRGFGLPVCLRIVEAHGGELRIENQGRVGTRVTVLLPSEAIASDSAGEE